MASKAATKRVRDRPSPASPDLHDLELTKYTLIRSSHWSTSPSPRTRRHTLLHIHQSLIFLSKHYLISRWLFYRPTSSRSCPSRTAKGNQLTALLAGGITLSPVQRTLPTMAANTGALSCSRPTIRLPRQPSACTHLPAAFSPRPAFVFPFPTSTLAPSTRHGRFLPF